MLKPEFEAACCLVSYGLFENLSLFASLRGVPALSLRGARAGPASLVDAAAARADPHARKRLGYAVSGMYWKFAAFGVRDPEEPSPRAAPAPDSGRVEKSPRERNPPGAPRESEPEREPESEPEPEPEPWVAFGEPSGQTGANRPERPASDPRADPASARPSTLASAIAWRTPAASAASGDFDRTSTGRGVFDDDAEAGLSPGFGFDATLDAGFERLRLGPDPPIGEREEGGVGADGVGAFDAETGAREGDAFDAFDAFDPNAAVVEGESNLAPRGLDASAAASASVSRAPPDAFGGSFFVSPSSPSRGGREEGPAGGEDSERLGDRAARGEEEVEWRAATRTWPWLAAAASKGAAKERPREEENEAEWEAFGE